MKLRPIERRILAYLDQRGEADRQKIVRDLSAPGTNQGDGYCNGSNGAAPLIFGAWASRLVKGGYVKEHRDFGSGQYRKHSITKEGRKLFRESENG